jgi:hypothetical protein
MTSVIGEFIKSIPGQFLIGGLTVAGIAYFSNNITNAAIAGVIGAIPVGMPSSVFVDDAKVEAYAYNLLIMTIPLFLATFMNWILLSKAKFNKYKSVAYSMLFFVVSASIIVLLN